MPHSYGYRNNKNNGPVTRSSTRAASLRTPQGIVRPGKQSIIPPQLFLKTIEELTGKRLDALTSAKIIKSAQWRVSTSTARFQRWASGADETIPTRMAVSSINKLKAKRDKLKLATELNKYRMDNSQHIWTTKDGQIAGHVPAIKHDPNDNQRSVTSEHGTRDRLREKIVKSVFDEGEESRKIAARAATIKYFPSPGEELLTAKPKTSVYSNYQHIGDLKNAGELRKLAQIQQEVREHHKIVLADDLWKAGRKSEVPHHYHSYMGKGYSPETIRTKMVNDMHNNPSFGTNTSTSSQADLTSTGRKTLARPLSPARRPIM